MKSIEVEVLGIVQGVGFRPFVYSLALKENLKGFVNNSSSGVSIALEGNELNINNFLEKLQASPPPLAKINSIESKETSIKNYQTFEIIKSLNNTNKKTIISPDIAVCEDCIKDISSLENQRYHYALTNCTNCGPRYSIINTVPYDRVNTSMASFTMCEFCNSEYENPLDRRYHAQPIACEKCGPKIKLFDKSGNEISKDYEAIKELALKIKQGHIVALKGLGGFHIVCDANNDEAINLLRQRKQRPTKPFAVMFKNIEQIKKHTLLSLKEEEVLTSKEKPIVIVTSNSKLSSKIAPNINKIGCFIAYTPLHHLLFKHLDNPIIATSANLSGEPILRFKDDVLSKLSFVVDYVLDFNRDIINACDDSVTQIVNDEIQVLRNARGYAPNSIKLEEKTSKKILALGANQKSTISLAFEDNLILSPHIGDLGSITSFEYFTRTIDTFKRFYDFVPEVIVCDKHPNYESVKWAKTQNIDIVQVQHHYAHLLSTMAENKIQKEVLAFCFDGTGYGDDGNIWGGEVFLANQKSYKRVYHFEYFKLLGGEKAVKEPKRVALSLLFENYSLEEVLALDNACVKAFSQNEIKLMHTLWTKGLNSPLTSSTGRLFDAVASLASLAQTQSYEGETGLLIEMAYDKDIKEFYDFSLEEGKIKLNQAIKQIVKDKNKNLISSKFINTLVEIIEKISKEYEAYPIVLTGGVFQNKTLLELVLKRLEEKELYTNKLIPPNDGGISIGQIYSLL